MGPTCNYMYLIPPGNAQVAFILVDLFFVVQYTMCTGVFILGEIVLLEPGKSIHVHVY